jgi:RimJ/RimL family protein N-acetyltransferase
MLLNSNTVLCGQKVNLVPYQKEHVLRYHEWMQSAELQKLTASEPLTLEEEYEMQNSWRNDPKKCTFIVCTIQNQSSIDTIEGLKEFGGMVGDVNLYFNDHENEHAAEIEIMIAEPEFRSSGFGKEAVTMMMWYAYNYLNVNSLTAKISIDNVPSINLFKKLGFQQVSVSEIFGEITMNRTGSSMPDVTCKIINI